MKQNAENANIIELSGLLGLDPKDPRAVHSMRRAIEILRELLERPANRQTQSARGRWPVHDRAWAESQLISMAIDPDGLDGTQSEIAARLQLRFETAGKPAPGRSWSLEVVGGFLRRSRVHESEARERFLRSPELSSAFSTAENYVKFCAWRMRVEERWLCEKDLQRRYLTPADYVAEIIGNTPWAISENVMELADIPG